jgi:PAS domain S-box-containing protein
MILEVLKVVAIGLQVLLIGVVVRQLWTPYHFPLWTKAWGWLLAALVLQTERQVYEMYWLPGDLRHVIVTIVIAGCMLASFQALWTILHGEPVLQATTPIAHLVVDQFSVIVAWDETAEQLFGWRASEAVGQTLMHTIIVPRDWEAHRAEMAQVRAAPPAAGMVVLHNYAVNARHKSGEELHVEMTVTVETLPDGAPRFLVAVRRLGRL